MEKLNSEKHSLRLHTTLFIFVVVVIGVSRSTYIFTQGRFWAEEGAIYFRVMYSAPSFFDAITYYYSNQGYFSLFANVANYFATFFPLEFAPLVTAYLSLLVILMVPILMFHLPSNRGVVMKRADKLKWSILCLAVLIGPLAYPEVWANTINAQVYFGVISFILLFYRMPKNVGAKVILIVSPLLLVLSSPYSTALGLGFLINLYFERTKFRVAQVISSSIGVALNAFLLVSASMDKTLDDDRSQIPTIFALLKSLGHYMTTVLLGQDWGLALLGELKTPTLKTFSILILVSCATFVYVGLSLAVADNQTRILMIFGFVTTYFLVNLVGLAGSYAGRYSATILGILAVIFLIGFMNSSQETRFKPINLVLSIAILVMIVTGGKDFWTFKDEQFSCKNCISWDQSVKGFKSGETKLYIWPYPNWSMELP